MWIYAHAKPPPPTSKPMHRTHIHMKNEKQLLIEQISFFVAKEWILSSKVRNNTGMPALASSIQHCTGG